MSDLEVTLPLASDLCARALDTTAAATMVVDPHGVMRVLSATDDRSDLIHLLEFHAGQGRP